MGLWIKLLPTLTAAMLVATGFAMTAQHPLYI
jgi:hypothetical protein